MAQSLFKACKNIIRKGVATTQDVYGYDIDFEYYTQEDIDKNVLDIKNGLATKCTFGDADESKVVLVASDEITIPSGFNLTPTHPKKSLVVICNKLVNNGTISMNAKAPYVRPHEWFIVGSFDGFSENVIIPAYANNGLKFSSPATCTNKYTNGLNGNNGVNRQCGSGGTGATIKEGVRGTYWFGDTGSGYAFGGGAGSGGFSSRSVNDSDHADRSADATYPSKGGNGWAEADGGGGGVGHPSGTSLYAHYWNYNYNKGWSGNKVDQYDGCGGRVVIFCKQIENNGVISANGVDSNSNMRVTYLGANGGASGGGAIDLFYSDMITEGTITAKGGIGASMGDPQGKSGNGGNGSVTLSEYNMPNVFKPEEKYMSKDNMIYFLNQLVARINGE